MHANRAEMSFIDKGAEQRDCRQHRGRNRQALGQSLGGVADRVHPGQRLGRLLLMDSAHLEDAVGVVGDRPVGVHREDEAGGGEQAEAGQRDSVKLERERLVENRHRADDCGCDHKQRPDRRLEALGHARQDQSCRAGARRHRGFSDWALVRMREIVGEPQRHDGENDPERRAAGEAPVGRAGARVVEVQIVDDEESEHGCDRRGDVADVDRAHRIDAFCRPARAPP